MPIEIGQIVKKIIPTEAVITNHILPLAAMVSLKEKDTLPYLERRLTKSVGHQGVQYDLPMEEWNNKIENYVSQ